MPRPRILVVLGTRPEVIKMAPVVHALRQRSRLDVRVVVTAQHRELLDDALRTAGLTADVDLDTMRPGQPLGALAARLLDRLDTVMAAERPERILVHGDTATTAAAALAAYYHRIPVGHVEAGLRSGDLLAPWPEEGHRRMVTALCDLHFAPTERAAAALRGEGARADTIHMTGNTGIDALLDMRGQQVVTVTVHRREAIGRALAGIAAAIARIADRPATAVVLPLHPAPPIAAALRPVLGGHPAITLLPSLDYPHFVRLMGMSDLILTDSGGVQEEAPSLGVPVLVLRDTTERPEGIAAGNAVLVGTDEGSIVRRTIALLDDAAARTAMARARNPYGDGMAAGRIAAIVERLHR